MRNIFFDFSESNFVVTGASSGMGREVAVQLSRAGANVLAIARGQDKLEELVKQEERIKAYPCDACDKERLKNGIESFVENYGKIDGAVHAAGISAITPLRRFSDDDARRVMDVSFWAGIYLMQVINKKRVSNDHCASVLFSSTSALAAERSLFAYASSKAALQTAARVIAKEIASTGRRVNTICPGWVQTAMTQKDIENHTVSEKVLNRHLLGIGAPNKVVGMVLFLLSQDADWITGENFIVDGGYMLGDD